MRTSAHAARAQEAKRLCFLRHVPPAHESGSRALTSVVRLVVRRCRPLAGKKLRMMEHLLQVTPGWEGEPFAERRRGATKLAKSSQLACPKGPDANALSQDGLLCRVKLTRRLRQFGRLVIDENDWGIGGADPLHQVHELGREGVHTRELVRLREGVLG